MTKTLGLLAGLMLATGVGAASIADLSIDTEALTKGVQMVRDALEISQKAEARRLRHEAELAAKGIAEVPASREAVRYEIDTHGLGDLLFDDWGELYVDRRFLTARELKRVREIEAFAWKHLIEPLQGAKVLPVPGGAKPATGPAVAPHPHKRAARAHAGTGDLPVFRGFEEARYQEHDELIARMVADFNAHKAAWCGGTAEQAAKMADVTPALVKAHMIEESGGNGPRSRAAWAVDPLQVNVPGDWGEEKELLGLVKPSRRNEGRVETNVRAAIMYLSRKGFGAAGRPAAQRPKGFFDGWTTALRRYNGRRDRTDTDRYYSEEYADRIVKRASFPDSFVPIEIRLSKGAAAAGGESRASRGVRETREVRYVANGGDDAADGRTPATAWRSLKKLSRDLPAGGTGLLKCGDTFFGEIKAKGGPDAAHSTVIASYGKGPKPVLTFSKVLKDDPKIWNTGTGTVPLYGIWWCDLTNPTNYVGVDTTDINPGTLLVDGDLKPWRKFCWHDINRQWDFSAQGRYLFVYSTNNPALLSREIQVSLNEGVVDFVSNFVISNVACRMIGSCAMCGGWNGKTVVRHVRVTDCDFQHIGGSALGGFEQGEFGRKVRFGNGVEFGNNVQDAIVERCRFDGVYDTAFTMQGYPTASWRDVHVRNCYFTNCAQAYELWCRKAPKGVGYERCSFTGNRCVGVGSGWGAETRPNRCVATPLLMYHMETDTMDIDVSGNVFEKSPNGIVFKLGELDKLPKGYRVHDNVVR